MMHVGNALKRCAGRTVLCARSSRTSGRRWRAGESTITGAKLQCQVHGCIWDAARRHAPANADVVYGAVSACCSARGFPASRWGGISGRLSKHGVVPWPSPPPLGGIVEADETYVEATEARNRGVTMTVISPKGATAATRSSSPSSGAGSPVRNEPARTRSGRSPRPCSWKLPAYTAGSDESSGAARLAAIPVSESLTSRGVQSLL
jgi:hypothetical protein